MEWRAWNGLQCLQRGLVARGSKQSKKTLDSIKIQKILERLGKYYVRKERTIGQFRGSGSFTRKYDVFQFCHIRILQSLLYMFNVAEASWIVMAHAQKPNIVFQRNGRVYLNRRGRQFSRLLATEVCASAVRMRDTPCSEVGWRVLATTPFASFPFISPPVRHRVSSHFTLSDSVSILRSQQVGWPKKKKPVFVSLKRHVTVYLFIYVFILYMHFKTSCMYCC